MITEIYDEPAPVEQRVLIKETPKFSFTPLDTKYPGFENRETQDLLFKWCHLLTKGYARSLLHQKVHL